MPGFLSESSRRRLQRRAEADMTASAEVQALSTTEGAGGADTTSWVAVAGLEAVACKFKPAAAPAEIVAADALRNVTRYLVKFPTGTAILPKHRLVITHEAEGIPSPLTMDVIGPWFRGREITRWVLCTLVGPAAAVGGA